MSSDKDSPNLNLFFRFFWVMTDEFTKTSFCVFTFHEKKNAIFASEKKKTLGLKLIDPCLKKRRRKRT